MILTKQEAVEKYGNNKQKEHFNKYGKIKSKKVEEALIKTIEQHFETVKIVPLQGRAKGYKLSSKREVIAERKDNRISNGAWSIPYTKNMDIMVVSVLEQGLETETAQTLGRWAVDFGLITHKMFKLLKSRYEKGLKASYIQELKNNFIINNGEERILNDFIYFVKEINGQLAGTLERMRKAGIIDIHPVYKGHIKETGETISLHEDTVKQILNLKRNLMEQFQVDDFSLLHYHNAQKVRDYNTKWKTEIEKITDETGEELGLDYFYKTFAIMLKAGKKKIITYLKKYNKEAIEMFKQNEELFLADNENTFYKERHDYVVEKAQKKEGGFLSKNIVELDEELKLFFDEDELARARFTFDKEYYALYFDRLYAQRIKKLQEYYGHTFE